MFKKIQFNHFYTYRPALGIYSIAHSNSTDGLFLTFKPDGKVHGVMRPFDTLDTDDNDWRKIDIGGVDSNMLNHCLDKTSFFKPSMPKSRKYNNRVRNCIRKESVIFRDKDAQSPTKIRKGRKRQLKDIIPKCKRKIESKISEQKLRTELLNLMSNEIPIDEHKKMLKFFDNNSHSRST